MYMKEKRIGLFLRIFFVHGIGVRAYGMRQ